MLLYSVQPNQNQVYYRICDLTFCTSPTGAIRQFYIAPCASNEARDWLDNQLTYAARDFRFRGGCALLPFFNFPGASHAVGGLKRLFNAELNYQGSNSIIGPGI